MKGIAIIAVVIGHCSINYVEGFVNQFHLATFYFLAGYFFKSEYISQPWTFIKKRINRLYIPFILYGTSFLLLHNTFCKLGLYSANIYTWKEIIQKEFYMIIRFSSNEPFVGAMWFLSSLFIVSIIFLILLKVVSYSKKSLWINKYAIAGGGDNPLIIRILRTRTQNTKYLWSVQCFRNSSYTLYRIFI